jgi:hypothetical protein
LIPTAFKLPVSMLDAIDRRSKSALLNRSAWVRQTLYKALIRNGGVDRD